MEALFYETDPLLEEHIYMFVYAEFSIEELSKTKFLPDNATSLTLFLNPKPLLIESFTGRTINFRISFAGQHSVSLLYSSAEPVRIINIDFLPWGAYSILGIEQSSLHNVTCDATLLLPALAQVLPTIENNLDNAQLCKSILETFLLEEFARRKKEVDKRIVQACKIITENSGKLHIMDLCKTVGISHTGLRNYFAQMIGVTPKLFGRIARFTAVQKFLGENPTAGWKEIVYRFDFFDQNHFIREFKEFTGAIPKDRRCWIALFEPMKVALTEGFAGNTELLKRYRDACLYQILHDIHIEK